MAKAIVSLALLVLFVGIATAYYNEGDPCYADDPKYYGYYAPHPIYCYRFLQCVRGTFVGRNCSPGLFWNQEEGACDWPFNVECSGQTTQRSTTTTEGPSTPYPTTYPTDSTTDYYSTDYYSSEYPPAE